MEITVGAPLPTLSQDRSKFAFNAVDDVRANVIEGMVHDSDVK